MFPHLRRPLDFKNVWIFVPGLIWNFRSIWIFKCVFMKLKKKKHVNFKCCWVKLQNMWILVFHMKLQKHVNFDCWDGSKNLWIFFTCFCPLRKPVNFFHMFLSFEETCEFFHMFWHMWNLQFHMFLKVNFTCFYMWNTCEKPVKINHRFFTCFPPSSVLQNSNTYHWRDWHVQYSFSLNSMWLMWVLYIKSS